MNEDCSELAPQPEQPAQPPVERSDTDERDARIRYVVDRIALCRDDSERAMLQSHCCAKLGIDSAEYRRLINTPAFFRCLDERKNADIVAPNYLELKRQQLGRALRGDVQSESALLRPAPQAEGRGVPPDKGTQFPSFNGGIILRELVVGRLSGCLNHPELVPALLSGDAGALERLSRESEGAAPDDAGDAGRE